MSAKISIQFEDGLIVQTYRFRDGGSVSSLYEAQKFCTADFLAEVSKNFKSMELAQSQGLQNFGAEDETEFPEII